MLEQKQYVHVDQLWWEWTCWRVVAAVAAVAAAVARAAAADEWLAAGSKIPLDLELKQSMEILTQVEIYFDSWKWQ